MTIDLTLLYICYNYISTFVRRSEMLEASAPALGRDPSPDLAGKTASAAPSS